MIKKEYIRDREIISSKFRKRIFGQRISKITIIYPGCVEICTIHDDRYVFHYKDAASWVPNV